MKEKKKSIEERIVALLEEGYEVVEEDNTKIVLQKTLYEEADGLLADWEEAEILLPEGTVRKRYLTNREVPGWEMDPTSGEWHKI